MSAQTPDAAPPSRLPGYREEAVDAADRGGRLEELLPVTSLRVWLLAVAALILIGATVLYAAITPRDATVQAQGRVVGLWGVGMVSASAEGQFGAFVLEPGTKVTVGQKVAEVITAAGPVPQYSQVVGELLGYLPNPGSPISVGEWLAQVSLQADDPHTALIMVDPGDAAKVTAGMRVTAHTSEGERLTGVVGDRTAAYPPDLVQEGMGILSPPDGPRVVMVVTLDQPGHPGYEFSATIMVSHQSLLEQLLGRT